MGVSGCCLCPISWLWWWFYGVMEVHHHYFFSCTIQNQYFFFFWLYFTIKQKRKEKRKVEQAKTKTKALSAMISVQSWVWTMASSVMCCLEELRWTLRHKWGLRGGSAGKESACNLGNLGSIPGLGRVPGERNGYWNQYSGLENSMDCKVHGVANSQTWLSDFHLRHKYRGWRKE